MRRFFRNNGLSILLFWLFFTTFIIGQSIAGMFKHNSARGGEVSLWGYLLTSSFWFESLQNWQSEFLAVFAMVMLTIWLREKGSPESKPVDAPHDSTGK